MFPVQLLLEIRPCELGILIRSLLGRIPYVSSLQTFPYIEISTKIRDAPDPDPFFTGSAAGSTGKIREKISAKWRKTVKKCKKGAKIWQKT